MYFLILSHAIDDFGHFFRNANFPKSRDDDIFRITMGQTTLLKISSKFDLLTFLKILMDSYLYGFSHDLRITGFLFYFYNMLLRAATSQESFDSIVESCSNVINALKTNDFSFTFKLSVDAFLLTEIEVDKTKVFFETNQIELKNYTMLHLFSVENFKLSLPTDKKTQKSFLKEK